MLERHLRRAYGEGLSDAALEREVRRTFRSYARYWMESFRLAKTSPSALDGGMTWEGVGHLEDALAGGKGAISVMPHLGGWDFGAAKRGFIPADVRKAPGGYRSFYYWRGGK